jgi:hypothetical protein
MASVTSRSVGSDMRRNETLLHDDYVAGRNVCGILISIITAAMIAGMGAVAWIALMAR